MIQFFEGYVSRINRPQKGASDNSTSLSVQTTMGFEVQEVQLPITVSRQEQYKIGSKILFYCDSASIAKFVCLLSDPTPVSSPIDRDTAEDEIETGEQTFLPGEVAIQAAGNDDDFPPTEGGLFWAKNCGDVSLYSGTMANQISVNDSSDSVDIFGNTLTIQGTGLLTGTHAFVIRPNLLGATTSTWGYKDPVLDTFISRIEIGDVSSGGAISLGITDPLNLVLLSGISYNPIPGITTPLAPQITLRAMIAASELTINPLGTKIVGPTFIGMLEAAFAVVAPVINFSGAFTVEGLSTFVGNTLTVGATEITGNLFVGGAAEFLGIVSLPIAPGTLLVGTLPGVTGSFASLSGPVMVTNGIITSIG